MKNLYKKDIEVMKSRLQLILDELHEEKDGNYSKTIGSLTMIESYVNEVKTKLLSDSGCKNIFNDN